MNFFVDILNGETRFFHHDILNNVFLIPLYFGPENPKFYVLSVTGPPTAIQCQNFRWIAQKLAVVDWEQCQTQKDTPEPTLKNCMQTPWQSKLTNPTHPLKFSAQYLKYMALQTGSKFCSKSKFCPCLF